MRYISSGVLRLYGFLGLAKDVQGMPHQILNNLLGGIYPLTIITNKACFDLITFLPYLYTGFICLINVRKSCISVHIHIEVFVYTICIQRNVRVP